MPRRPDDPHLSKQELAQFRAEVRAFELRHHARRRSHRPNGNSWKHLQRKLDEAARGAAKLELTAGEVQRLAQAVTATKEPAPAPTPRRHLSARERREIVRLARRRMPYRIIARRFGVPFQTVAYWVRRAGSQPLDAIDWRNRAPGPAVPHNKIDPRIERIVILTRERLIEDRAPAYGPDAILAALRLELREDAPSRKTIVRIIRRNGLLTPRRRLMLNNPPPR